MPPPPPAWDRHHKVRNFYMATCSVVERCQWDNRLQQLVLHLNTRVKARHRGWVL